MSEENNLDGIVSTNFIDEFVKEDIGPGGRCEGMRVHTVSPPSRTAAWVWWPCQSHIYRFWHGRTLRRGLQSENGRYQPCKGKTGSMWMPSREDIRWLGHYDWEDRFYFASDYFEAMYQGALELILEKRARLCLRINANR